MTLHELAERLESASGPDRELDAEIVEALSSGSTVTAHLAMGLSRRDPRPYTASVEAAITLVPSEALFTVRTLWDGNNVVSFASVSRYENAEFRGHYRRYWMDEHQANAATPAIALCAAVLKARDAMPQEDTRTWHERTGRVA